MFRINLILLTLFSVSQTVYISRMSTVNRVRAPPPFRPGLMLQRPMYPQRLVASPSHRPYVVYRNTPQRYAIKKYNSSPIIRNVFGPPWKNTTPRLPATSPVVTSEFDFVRSASSPPIVSADGTGAIHTIPAPNLSLSEKPIVVIDSDNVGPSTAYTAKPTYEVTEKHPEQIYQTNGKATQPVGFSKPQEFSPIDYQNIRTNAALQFASEYSLPAIQLPQNSFAPQQFAMQVQGLFHGINGLPSQFPNILHHRGPEGIVIPPNPLFQSDPSFLQKLQSQLIQQYPSLEFIPYAPDVQPQSIPEPAESQPQIYLLQNEQIVKQEPSAFTPSNENKNIVQRETEEKSVVPLIPQAFTLNNVTERSIDTTTIVQPLNVTLEFVAETQAPTTTIKYVMQANEEEKTTPIYYAQVGQSIDNVIANNIFSAIQEVRERQPQSEPESTVSQKPITTTTTEATTTRQIETKAPTTQIIVTEETNPSNIDLNLIGAPFEKTAESVNVAYTLLRANENQSKLNKDGSVFAGQLVEAKVSEDQDFNKEKAIFAKRAPLRLFAVTEKQTTESPKMNIVKAKVSPKSKLTIDDKTGEPVLRIYASYVNNPFQKDALTTRMTNLRTTTIMARKQDNFDSWKATPTRNIEKLTSDSDQETQFGLKLKSRSDDYIPLFDEYDE